MPLYYHHNFLSVFILHTIWLFTNTACEFSPCKRKGIALKWARVCSLVYVSDYLLCVFGHKLYCFRSKVIFFYKAHSDEQWKKKKDTFFKLYFCTRLSRTQLSGEALPQCDPAVLFVLTNLIIRQGNLFSTAVNRHCLMLESCWTDLSTQIKCVYVHSRVRVCPAIIVSAGRTMLTHGTRVLHTGDTTLKRTLRFLLRLLGSVRL